MLQKRSPEGVNVQDVQVRHGHSQPQEQQQDSRRAEGGRDQGGQGHVHVSIMVRYTSMGMFGALYYAALADWCYSYGS